NDCSPIVYIPDVNFKNALLSNTAINPNNDTEISYNEAAAFTGTMDVSRKGIADLTGIEAFVNITHLYCRDNALTSLDVSANTALTRLYCDDNALTSLDVSANTALRGLYCDDNALTSLNVANGNNTNLITFTAENNPNLSCIQVDDVTYSNTNWANDIDTTASFSTDCSPIVYIPDVNFKNALLSNTAVNTNNDTEISYNEAAAFTGTMDVSFNNIADLTGIEAFVNITRLYCNYNNLTSLEVANNLALEELRCNSNNLTSLDVSANTALTRLICYDNALTSLDVSANTALTSLYCNNNALTSLNVANGNNTNLITFTAENNPNLSCIQVDDVTYSNANWANDIDTTASFSNDCSPIVYIPDVNFKNALLSNTAINPNNDTEISYN
ncbi:hypothetical protein Q4Q35_15500, partial [Flavivirga aquimarina]|nr:hypothetical protein [Flavivirga aquimarina]